MEIDFLHICLKTIAQKINEGEIEKWTDSSFIRLSEAVEAKTGILISKNTLKRLFGKMKTPNEYNPQRDTKNALAIYAGYKSWDHFKEEISKDEQYLKIVKEKKLADSIAAKMQDIDKKKNSKVLRIKTIFISILVVTLSMAIFFFLRPQKVEKLYEPRAKMQIKNPIDTVPYTMHVSFETKNVIEDSLFIGGEKVITNTGRFNMGISTPIYTWLTLKYKNKLLALRPYHALSKGWMTYYQKKNKKNFVLVKPPSWNYNSQASISKKWFQGNILDSTSFFWYLKNFKNFPLQGDDFTLECKANIQGDGVGCGGILFVTFGESGHLETCLNSRSCANHNFLYLSDLIVEGEYNDLPNLDIQPNEWSVIRMEVKNKKVRLLVNSKLVFEGKYEKEIGRIKGFNLKFQGFGAVDYFKAWDSTGKLIEDENF